MKLPTERLPFITGSKVYGVPTEASDTDIIMCMSLENRAMLYAKYNNTLTLQEIEQLPASASDDCSIDSFSFYHNNINLIIVNEANYDIWKSATAKLITMKPVTRSIAVTLIQSMLLTKSEKC